MTLNSTSPSQRGHWGNTRVGRSLRVCVTHKVSTTWDFEPLKPRLWGGGGGTFLVPLTERERIPGTWALPPFPSMRTKPGAPCQEAGAELCQGPSWATPALGAPSPAFYPLLPW